MVHGRKATSIEHQIAFQPAVRSCEEIYGDAEMDQALKVFKQLTIAPKYPIHQTLITNGPQATQEIFNTKLIGIRSGGVFSALMMSDLIQRKCELNNQSPVRSMLRDTQIVFGQTLGINLSRSTF